MGILNSLSGYHGNKHTLPSSKYSQYFFLESYQERDYELVRLLQKLIELCPYLNKPHVTFIRKCVFDAITIDNVLMGQIEKLYHCNPGAQERNLFFMLGCVHNDPQELFLSQLEAKFSYLFRKTPHAEGSMIAPIALKSQRLLTLSIAFFEKKNWDTCLLIRTLHQHAHKELESLFLHRIEQQQERWALADSLRELRETFENNDGSPLIFSSDSEDPSSDDEKELYHPPSHRLKQRARSCP